MFIEIYAYYRYDDSEKRMYIKGGNKDKKGGRNMSEDRDDHLYTVSILIIAIALMMFTENKSSCSFPALNTVLALLSGLF